MKKITKREENFAEWYTSVCLSAKLCSYGAVKGTINYLPYGWRIWELIQENLNKRLAEYGAQNVQLPLFIKNSDFLKEKAHIEGFAPETFIVDNIGGQKLSDPLIVRPTSEVLFSQLFKEQIYSYKDLPLKYNQWCSVYRAEKNTKPFLRGCEFFWHELHCMFENEEQAKQYVIDIHNLYDTFLKDICCLPVLSGKKTEGEKFPGAVETYTREVLSQDGQCIQTGTSHYLGTNFSKMYDVKFQTKENKVDFPHYTSHGITTRLIGDLIVVHADDNGLVLPWDIAPYQISILTILGDKKPEVIEFAKNLACKLSNYRVKINSSNDSLGFKISDEEILGTPIVIALGPNDIANNKGTIIRRDKQEKIQFDLEKVVETIEAQKSEYTDSLYIKAKNHLDSSIVEISSIDELKQCISSGKVALAYWGGTIEDEAKIKELTTATPRCVKEELVNSDKKCFFTNNRANQLVYFARAY